METDDRIIEQIAQKLFYSFGAYEDSREYILDPKTTMTEDQRRKMLALSRESLIRDVSHEFQKATVDSSGFEC